MTWVIVVAVIALIGIIIRGMMSQSDATKGYGWRLNVLYDAKTGERFDLEPNLLEPWNIIYSDPNKKQNFVKRKKKMMDKGPDSIYLDDHWDSQGMYDSWRLIINNVNAITGVMKRENDYYKDKITYHKNLASHIQAKNLQLTMKADEHEMKQVEKARKRVIIPQYKKPGAR